MFRVVKSLGSLSRSPLAVLTLIIFSAILIVAGPSGSVAYASTGGYPFATYSGPGTNPATYTWTDNSGNEWSPYGYAYRNCTDYVAWKLDSLGVADAKWRGLGNGGQWLQNASGRSGVSEDYTPRYGDAAVNTTAAPPYGHVSFVDAVHSDGTVSISEYNYGTRGNYGTRRGTRTQLGITKFIHFGVTTTPPVTSSQWGGLGSAAYLGGGTLSRGQLLRYGQYILSGNGLHALVMQSDGNLVLYGMGKAQWSTKTGGNPGAYLAVQTDGNFVVYAANGRVLWNGERNNVDHLTLQSDGNLVARTASGAASWNSGTVTSQSYHYLGDNKLAVGQQMNSGDYIRSADNRFGLLMQEDGNLVLYSGGYHVLWHTETGGNPGHPGAYLAAQTDGNVVLYAADGRPLWNTETNTAAFTVLQNDGNLVTRDANDVAIWNSGTMGDI